MKLLDVCCILFCGGTKKSSANQLTTDKNFIKMADVFIAEANQLCEVKDPDHQLVNAALLYQTRC
jgi:hypothetical protein